MSVTSAGELHTWHLIVGSGKRNITGVGHVATACRSKPKLDRWDITLTERERRQRPNHRSHKVQESQLESESNSSEE